MTELTLDVFDLQLAGIQQPAEDGQRCLCLHGWLDNAASFTPLMKALPALDMVAIDLPGHGLSDHFAAGHHYPLLDHIAYVLGAADALGWDQFHLIGHSLGGCIGPMIAVAAPHRVASLTMIEATGPLTETADALPSRIKNATASMRAKKPRLHRVYASVGDGVDARLRATQMLRCSAHAIVERSLKPTPGGYTWRFDSKLRLPSPTYLSEEQVLAVLDSVEQQTLCVFSSNGYVVDRTETETRLSALRHKVTTEVPGHHHMHMDDPEPTAAAIRTFLLHNRI